MGGCLDLLNDGADLLLALGGAAGFEGAARSKFGEADSRARGLAKAGDIAGARLGVIAVSVASSQLR